MTDCVRRVQTLKIEIPRYTERFGAIQINEVQRVYELDSGNLVDSPGKHSDTIRTIGRDVMTDIESRMAIVVSTKDENIRLVEGVLSGIPHNCLIILVSNSARRPLDRYKNEVEMVKRFHQFAQRDVYLIHQKDPGLGKIFREVGYPEVIQGNQVRSGKGEGVVVGLLLAKLAKKDFVGFVDADNYIPGAVHEYVKNFSSGFYLATSPYSMTRISWLYKPTATGTSFYFSKWGRVNEYSNRYLNRLISAHSGFGTEIIKTGNSGEYAMSMKLAEMLSFSSGVSTEPYVMVNLLEEFGPFKPIANKDVREKGVQIYQIETRNPHIHVDKSDEHLANMLLSSIGAIYHSNACTDNLRKTIRDELASSGLVKAGNAPSAVTTMRPISCIDLKKFQSLLQSETKTLFTSGETMFQSQFPS
jgi:mannosyl-3-phosphoglycerate synthase